MNANRNLAGRSISLLMGCITAVALCGCVAADESSAESDALSEEAASSRVTVGLWATDFSPKDIKGREQDLGGAKLDHVLLFQNINSLGKTDPLAGAQRLLDAGYDVIINLELWPEDPSSASATNGNLKEIARGDYDGKIKSFASALKSLKRNKQSVWVRTLHEMNGFWYPWCVNGHKDNTIADYKKAYRHVASLIGGAAKMQVQFNSHDYGPSGAVNNNWEDLYPGDDIIDMVVFSVYNSYGLKNSNTWRDFGKLVDDPYQKASKTKMRSKPFGIGEMSSNPDPDQVKRKGQWFRDMASDIAKNHTKITQVSLFLEDKPSSDGPHCYDWAYPTKNPNGVKCPVGAERSKDDKDGIRDAVSALHRGG